MYNLNYSIQRKKNTFNYSFNIVLYNHKYSLYYKYGMNRIKEILKEKGITQQEFADMLGITRISVVKTLAGNPSQETLEKMANALNVPMWQLFASPTDIQKADGSFVCPNCGTPLELKIKE